MIDLSRASRETFRFFRLNDLSNSNTWPVKPLVAVVDFESGMLKEALKLAVACMFFC